MRFFAIRHIILNHFSFFGLKYQNQAFHYMLAVLRRTCSKFAVPISTL